MKNIIDLTNKRILVTGASRGIGQNTSVLLSQLGAEVIIAARTEEGLKDTLSKMDNGNHHIWQIDLTDIDGIESKMDELVKTVGKLDGIVHCAGISPARTVKMSKYDYFHSVMLINFYSFAELVRVFSKKKNNNGGGSIVAMSSVAAHVGDKTKAAYAASKAALEALVRTYAYELSEKNIRLNTVVGGLIRTDMYEVYVRALGIEAVEKSVLSRQYMGLGEVDDVSNAIAYLLSDASKFITGTGLTVDGGYLS